MQRRSLSSSRFATIQPSKIGETLEEGIREGKIDLTRVPHIKLEKTLEPDRSVAMGMYAIGRMVSENYSDMGDYVAHLMEVFEKATTCEIYLYPKNKFSSRSYTGLEHRLTIFKQGENYGVDEAGDTGKADYNPLLRYLIENCFGKKQPAMLDFESDIKLVFEDLNIGNRNCIAYPLEMSEKIFSSGSLAVMPFYYRDPVSPSGVVTFEGALGCRGSVVNGIEKMYWSSVVAVEASAQISFMLTHKFDAITILTKAADFNADLKQGIREVVEGKLKNLYLIMVDIDDFKKVNDTYSYRSGNEVLRCVAETIKASVRSVDTVSRWGGEEFAVILRNVASKDEAVNIAERIRFNIEQNKVEIGGKSIGVTCSIGVTEVSGIVSRMIGSRLAGTDDVFVDLVFNKAFDVSDKGVKEAKGGGKNRVCYRVDRTTPPL